MSADRATAGVPADSSSTAAARHIVARRVESLPDRAAAPGPTLRAEAAATRHRKLLHYRQRGAKASSSIVAPNETIRSRVPALYVRLRMISAIRVLRPSNAILHCLHATTHPQTTDPTKLSACELLAGYARRELSPVEVTRAVLARIAADNDKVNAFCLVDEAAALHAASESEERWRAGRPMGACDGVPATVKELMLAKHWPTLRCSTRRRTRAGLDGGRPERRDASRARRGTAGEDQFAGVRLEGCHGLTAVRITRNPWDLSRRPGAAAEGRQWRRHSGWAPCTSAPTAADRFGFRRRSPASSDSSLPSVVSRSIRRARSGRPRMSAR